MLKAISHSSDQVCVQGILCHHVVKHSTKVYTETFAKDPTNQPLCRVLLVALPPNHLCLESYC